MSPPCFYCGTPRAGTDDHLYPRSMISRLTFKQKVALPEDFYIKNKVPACHSCNSMKGRLHPLDWLVIMPDNHRAAKVATHMVRMGENMEQVFNALRRRRR